MDKYLCMSFTQWGQLQTDIMVTPLPGPQDYPSLGGYQLLNRHLK